MTIRRMAVAVLVSLLPFALHAQIAEQNVNMVAGRTLPGGDPWLQRQNEPSIAVSSRNPLHVMAGANDYRSVDMPGLPNGDETGDAWLGVFKSFNGGQTWQSTLLAGYPQDQSSAAFASPLHGFQAAADTVVRAGANGMFYFSGIVLNRDPNNPLGGVFVARFIDNNNTESGDPIGYIDTSMIDRGTAGQFIDKPWVAVAPGPAGAAPCTVNGQTFPAQNVYLAYTVFVGNTTNLRTKMMFVRSTNCGASWEQPTKLSETQDINQGPAIAVAPSGAVYVTWRRFHNSTQTDAILVAKSTDNGRTFGKAVKVADISPFEQGTTTVSMRTNAYPTIAVDPSGRAYIAWSQRVGPAGDARVVLSSSTDGASWTMPLQVDVSPKRGHQFMPSLTFAGGKLLLIFYDLREDHTVGIFTPLGGGSYSESRVDVGDLPGNPDVVFTPFLMDISPAGMPRLKLRHTIDLRAVESNGGLMPAFSSQRISRYRFGSIQGSSTIQQLQLNVPNLPMFKQGTVPFFGDYIDVTGYASSTSTSPVFHAAWTDNRDVRPPLDGDWTHYTPVGPGHDRISTFNGQTAPDCVPGQTGMRNQNIYTARITNGLFAGSPGNAKPLGHIQRAFAVFVQNAENQTKSFRLSIVQQPAGGTASFLQLSLQPTLDVTIPRHSSTTRTVFVNAPDPHARIDVQIAEISAPGDPAPLPGGLSTDVILNPDVSNPDVSNPDVSNPDVSNAEVYNPDVSNPDVSNPDVSNPDVSNPDVSNPDVSNPDVSNPDVSNPDVSNPDVSNPDVSNPDVSNSSVTDTTWTAQNDGNTTSGYTLHLFGTVPGSVKTQLIVNRIYDTPIARDCELGVEHHRQVIANIVDPMFATSPLELGSPDLTDSTDKSTTFWLNPHDTVRLTLRTFDPTHTFDAAQAITPVIVAHAINTVDLQNGITQPPISLTITTTSLPDAMVAAPYSATLQAIGGIGAKTWSLYKAPAWMSVDPTTGVLSGTPTTPLSTFVTFAVADSANPPNVATRTLQLNVLGSVVPAVAAAGFGQLVAIEGTNIPNPSTVTVNFSDGTVTEPGFVFPSPSSSSLLFVRLPFVGDGSNTTTANLQPGPVTVSAIWGGTPQITSAVTVSTTPGAPVIRFILPTTSVINSPGCPWAVGSSTPMTEISPGIPIGISAFGVDTVGATVQYEQNGNIVGEFDAFCVDSDPVTGVTPLFVVPAMTDGPAIIRVRATVNGVAGPWSAPVNVTVKNLIIG